MFVQFHGIDRQKKYSTVSVLDRDGQEVRFLRSCASNDAVVMEASIIEGFQRKTSSSAASRVQGTPNHCHSPGSISSGGASPTGTKTNDAELMQYRCPVGPGPSSKTCPRWAPERESTTSIRMKNSESSLK